MKFPDVDLGEGTLLAMSVAFLTWIGKRFVAKVDAKAERSELLSMAQEGRVSREKLYSKLDDLSQQVSYCREDIARLQGRLGDDEQAA